MTRGNRRDIDRKRAQNRAKNNKGKSNLKTRENDADIMRKKQEAAAARKAAAAEKKK